MCEMPSEQNGAYTSFQRALREEASSTDTNRGGGLAVRE